MPSRLRAGLIGGVVGALALGTNALAFAQAYPNGGEDGGNGAADGGSSPEVLGETVFPSPGGAPSGGGDLAFTGARILLLVALAAALITVGVIVVREARRRGLLVGAHGGQPGARSDRGGRSG